MIESRRHKKIAFISDVHGCEATLKALLAKIPEGYTPVFGGDLIDRGKRSREVIQLIIDNEYPCVMGNHDFFMVDERDPRFWKARSSLWWANGGKSTIRSYGGKWKISNDSALGTIFRRHRNFLENLPIIIKFPNIKVNGREVWVSHSPLDRTMDIAMTAEILEKVLKTCDRKQAFANPSSPEGLIVQNSFWRHWDDGIKSKYNKKPQGYPKDNFPFFNATGHTTLWDVHIDKHFACVDTGAYDEKEGKMSALLLPDMKIIEQEHIEDTYLYKKN